MIWTRIDALCWWGPWWWNRAGKSRGISRCRWCRSGCRVGRSALRCCCVILPAIFMTSWWWSPLRLASRNRGRNRFQWACRGDLQCWRSATICGVFYPPWPWNPHPFAVHILSAPAPRGTRTVSIWRVFATIGLRLCWLALIRPERTSGGFVRIRAFIGICWICGVWMIEPAFVAVLLLSSSIPI